ncbi:MAG: NUDIX domain-containing protein [Acidimicrobiia bacterium]
MARHSAGLILHRPGPDGPEVLLVHPGGPFWAKKDAGAWSIPKGEVEPDEAPLAVARREFTEELGLPVPDTDPCPLGDVTQAGGKVVTAWAVRADLDVTTIVSNTFELEWPPRSGRIGTFPEVDRAAWFEIATARAKINIAQSAFLDRLPPTG